MYRRTVVPGLLALLLSLGSVFAPLAAAASAPRPATVEAEMSTCGDLGAYAAYACSQVTDNIDCGNFGAGVTILCLIIIGP